MKIQKYKQIQTVFLNFCIDNFLNIRSLSAKIQKYKKKHAQKHYSVLVCARGNIFVFLYISCKVVDYQIFMNTKMLFYFCIYTKIFVFPTKNNVLLKILKQIIYDTETNAHRAHTGLSGGLSMFGWYILSFN